MKIILTFLSKFIMTFSFFTFASPFVMAGGNHGASPPQSALAPPPPSFSSQASNDVIKGRLIDVMNVNGYEVSVKVVDVNDSIPDGGSHNILVKINRDREIIRNNTISVNVTFPDHSEKSKSLFELGDWYLAGFDMGQTGKHEILISFRKKFGETHHLKVSYP